MDVDFNYYLLAITLSQEKKIDTHNLKIYKVLDHYGSTDILIELNPIYSTQIHSITKDNLYSLLRKEDWETKLQVLPFRVTEMFQKSFRKEYLALHEYKACKLDTEIHKQSDNSLFILSFSHASRKIVGVNNGVTLVTFEYVNVDESIKVMF